MVPSVLMNLFWVTTRTGEELCYEVCHAMGSNFSRSSAQTFLPWYCHFQGILLQQRCLWMTSVTFQSLDTSLWFPFILLQGTQCHLFSELDFLFLFQAVSTFFFGEIQARKDESLYISPQNSEVQTKGWGILKNICKGFILKRY